MAAQIPWDRHSLGRDSLPVLNSFIVCLAVATILGFLAGLGVGGGSLLILWLTFVLQYDHPQARIINLLFFIPAAIISSVFRWRQGTLNWRKMIPAIITGCIAAGICSIVSHHINLDIIKKLFGGLLLITGIRELFYKCKSSS